MEMTGSRRLVRHVLRAVVLLVAAISVSAVLTGSAIGGSAHHALADNGVINSHN
jgi:hypothetical protein